MGGSWGKILLGTRVEKTVEDNFFIVWSALITQGLKKGDGYSIVRGHMLHKGLNQLARELLKSNMDSLLSIDSDCDTDPKFIDDFRNLKAGWEFDALQAFYTRRGWPPEAIWFKRNAIGDNVQCILTDPDLTEEVSVIGTHAALFRREIFEKIYEAEGKPNGISLENFEWFYFPRHQKTGEDGAFSIEMAKYGYRLGATTSIRVGHRSVVTTGWDTYQEFIQANGIIDRVELLRENIDLVAKFINQDRDVVEGYAMRGNENVNSAWKESTPRTPEEIRAFYGAINNGYFYDLIAWNSNPFYLRMVEPLETVADKDCLVIGPGIGGELIRLVDKNRVSAFELPGAMKEFCQSRFDGSVRWLNAPRIDALDLTGDNLPRYDLIVAMDVIEHVHPDELPAFLDTIVRLTKPRGYLYTHTNFSPQGESYPQHFDHSEYFGAWLKENYDQIGEGLQWQLK